MSTQSVPGKQAPAGAHRVLRCAGGFFVANDILTIVHPERVALQPLLTPLDANGVAPNNPCVYLRGPGPVELNRYQSP